jgi:hypothetical protein
MSQLSQIFLVKYSENSKEQKSSIKITTQNKSKIKINSEFIISNFNKVLSNYEDEMFTSSDFESSYKSSDILK